jgi:Late embryogenesis abundant protein
MKTVLWRRMLPVLLLVLAAAGAPAPPAKKNIGVSLERKGIREMDSSGLILVFYLELANSSRTDYSLTEYDYRVVVEGTDYFALKTSLESPILVEKEAATRIALPIKITYADLLERVPGAANLPKSSCYVTGLMIFTDSRGRQEKIPFAFSGDFPVFRDLELEVKPLDIKTLTIGGTEFTLSFTLRNRNSFGLTLGQLAYKLELEGRAVAQGVLPGGKTIESQAEFTLSLPHMLEFFEVGREVYDILQKPSAAGVLSVDSQFESIWGTFKLRLTGQGNIPFIRAQ